MSCIEKTADFVARVIHVEGEQIQGNTQGKTYDIFYFGHKNPTFGHIRFSTRFFSLKTADLEKVVIEYCIIDFNEKQV
jgi:hypothetical protein